MEGWQSDLVCCTFVITNDIKQGVPQKHVALTYAMAIKAEHNKADRPDWGQINQAIIDKWGLAGLARVKKRAWQLIEDRQRKERPEA